MLNPNAPSAEVEQFFVSPTWVAAHFDISLVRVHRMIQQRELIAARVQGGPNGRWTWVLDRRLLPLTVRKRRRRKKKVTVVEE